MDKKAVVHIHNGVLLVYFSIVNTYFNKMLNIHIYNVFHNMAYTYLALFIPPATPASNDPSSQIRPDSFLS